MQNTPVNLLFRKDLKPEDFNDDIVGHALDRPFENDLTKIFMQITEEHAKNKRYDPNQFVVSLITDFHADFPFRVDVLSGNTSDKAQF